MQSKELVDRLAKLQDLADKNAYKELVKDVTKSADDDREYFSSYKNSLGFGNCISLSSILIYIISTPTVILMLLRVVCKCGMPQAR